jgi:GEVED domain/Metallo-peptidase family M12/Fibronectin type III domain
MKNRNFTHLLILFCLFITIIGNTQTLATEQVKGNMLSQLVAKNKTAFNSANAINPLSRQVNSSVNAIDLMTRQINPQDKIKQKVGDVTLLTLDKGLIKTLYQQKPNVLILKIPYKNQEKHITLVKQEVTTSDFTVLDAKTNNSLIANQGVHYRGIVGDDDKSLAAFSFFENTMMGMFSAQDVGDVNIGRLTETNDDTDYVAYGTNDVDFAPSFNCDVKDDLNRINDIKNSNAVAANQMVSGCVRLSLDIGNDLYIYNGKSVQNTINHMTGIMNVVAALYQNEQISIKVSQMFIWRTPDTFSPFGQIRLNEFRLFRTVFNGDLALLVKVGNNGIAYRDVICSNNNYGYCGIDPAFYAQLPNYSYTIFVLSHEIGHNLGSPHTHSCTWPGGPIDGCQPVEDGSCPRNTTNFTHTVMSGCYNTATHNGFGPLPGNLIRNKVQNAACLSSSCTVPGCTPPSNFTLSSFPSTTSATFTWSTSSGNTSITLQYRKSGTTDAWTTVNNAVSLYTINNLIPTSNYEVQIQALCGATNSDFLPAIVFKPSAHFCFEPTNLSVVSDYQSATLSWTENASAIYWEIKYGPSGFNPATSGTSINFINTNPYTLTNLTPNTVYDWYVRSSCEETNQNTPYSIKNTFLTCQNVACVTTCSPPTNLILTGKRDNQSVILNWIASSNNTDFVLRYRVNGSGAAWTNIDYSGSNVLLDGLEAATTYEVQVSAKCFNLNSTFTPSLVFTTTGCSYVPIDLMSTPSNTSAVLEWYQQGSISSWQIKYGPSGFNPNVSGILVTATSNPYTLSNLNLNTTYDWYIRSVCANGFSNYSAVNTFTTPTSTSYCEAEYFVPCGNITTPDGVTTPLNIDRFWLRKDSDYSDVLDNPNSGCLGSTSDHTTIIGNVVRGETYRFDVFFGKNFNGGYYPAYIGIWVDFNGDDDFDDSNETLFLDPDSFTEDGTFDIPTNISNGNKRLRVRRSNVPLTMPNPSCAGITFGEAEDYTLNITSNSNTNIKIAAKVFLEGAYNLASGWMRDDLRANNKLPTSQPFSTLTFSGTIAINSSSPSTHSGSETINAGVLSVTGSNAIVDWVLVELRNSDNASIIVSSRAALLQRDGDVVDMDGVSPISFVGVPIANYHIAIRHRIHLPIRTVSPIVFTTASYTTPINIDFTNASNALALKMKQMTNGKYALFGGDVDRTSTNISTDISQIRGMLDTSLSDFDYLTRSFDVDMNGVINADDIIICRRNLNKFVRLNQ